MGHQAWDVNERLRDLLAIEAWLALPEARRRQLLGADGDISGYVNGYIEEHQPNRRMEITATDAQYYILLGNALEELDPQEGASERSKILQTTSARIAVAMHNPYRRFHTSQHATDIATCADEPHERSRLAQHVMAGEVDAYASRIAIAGLFHDTIYINADGQLPAEMADDLPIPYRALLEDFVVFDPSTKGKMLSFRFIPPERTSLQAQ